MSFKKNVAANYFGQGWQALMNLAFIPVYIKYLGIEAYGLIGIYALLQAWLVLLDMGMKPALAREMARFTGGAHSAQSIRDLLRSIELIGLVVAGVIALGIWAASGWLAIHWVTAKHLPAETVAHAFTAMGLVIALRFIQDIYVSCSAGLQRQVQQNMLLAITATVRGLGAFGLLAWVSPTIGVFFLWQAFVSIITVALFVGLVYRALPTTPTPARFSWPAMMTICRFAAGVASITLLGLLLTQVDKVLLSRLLTLEAFGYYALAGVVASSLTTMAGPISAAVYPRLTELTTSGDETALRRVYHQAAQMVTVFMGSTAMVLIMFGHRVLLLWTGNPLVAQKVAPLLIVSSLGTLLNCLMYVPYQMQLAHGWTSLTIKVNMAAVAFVVPAIFWVVPHYGAIGAAWICTFMNAGCLMFNISLMHRRLLLEEKWRWCFQDVAIPLAAAIGTAMLCRYFTPENLGRIGQFIAVLTSSICVLVASIIAASAIRTRLTQYLPSALRWLAAPEA